LSLKVKLQETWNCNFSPCFTKAQQHPVGQGPPIIEDLRSQSDTLYSVEILWTSDQLVAETST